MNREEHLIRYEMFQRSVERNYKERPDDFAPIVENSVMAAFHRIKAFLAIKGIHAIKHQRLSYEIRTVLRDYFKNPDEIADTYESLEDLRPAHVYGKKRNGETSKKAINLLKEVVKLVEEEER